MSSPHRRQHKTARVEEIHGADGRTQQRLPELDAPSIDKASRVSSAETKAQTCEDDDDDICGGAPNARQYLELDKLPEDMLHHIHSLLPLQDAARAACVSRGFLRSWRFYSNLTLNWKTLGSTDDKFEGCETRYINKIDKILNNYSENGMKKLKFLMVRRWYEMQAVEISAPNLSTFHYIGSPVEISIRYPSQLKDVYLASFVPSRILSYGRANLPFIARHVERLTLISCGENVNTPMLPDKLLHLKSLGIRLYRSRDSPIYDIFSVVSFLDASPALESFILHAERDDIINDCVTGDDLYASGESAYQHDCLKRVKIMGFHSAKSLIKLVIHILGGAPSLESLTLDTTGGYGRKPGDTSKCTASGENPKCCCMSERDVEYADRAVEAAGRYIVGRVPSAVKFEVLEPCRRCYTGNR
ncbi:hypothetical protein ACQ4PT_032009 [Festuca glaucescens]